MASVSAMWTFRWMMHRRRGLRMMVVSLLSGSPKNGVELMDEIERMTRGWWRPSPGSIYPVLEQLSNEGFIRKREDGRYELTQKGQEELEWPFGPSSGRPGSVEELVNEVSGFVSLMEDLARGDRGKIEPYLPRLRELAERLSSLAGEKRG
jgi:DNA-binding PadR family transcriptional regulator